MKPRKIQFIPTAVITAFASLAFYQSACAETYYWDADGATTAGFTTAASGTWGTSAFWSTDSTGSTNGANTTITDVDDVNFGTATSGFGTASIVALSGSQSVRSITFGAGNTATLAISNTGLVPLTLGSGSVITNNSASTFTIGAPLAGSNGFEKAGTGTLILNNNNTNTISGPVVVSAGTLSIQNKPLNNVSSVAINGGTLVIATLTANAIGADNNAKISFSGGTLQYNVDTPSTDYSARFSTTANQQYKINVISVSGTPKVVTFSSNLASAGGTLTKTGPGTLILAADNTFSGATTVTTGTLQLNNALALQNSAIDTTGSITGTTAAGIILNGVTTPTFGGLTGNKNLASLFNSSTGNYGSVSEVKLNPGTGASHSYSGVIANGAANMKLTKTGVGTQTLTGPNTYSGDTTVSAGFLTLGANNVIGDSSVVKLDGGTLNTANGVVESLHSIQATEGKLLLGASSTAGSADITLLNDSVIHNIDVGINGTLRLAANKTLTQTVTGVTAQLATGDTFTLDIGAGGIAHLSGALNSGGGDGGVTKTGSGTLRLTGATSQWGGATVIENGTLEFNTIGDYNVVSSLGDGDNGADLAGTNDAIIRIGSTATAATLKMIGTEVKNSSNRSIQLGDAGGGIDVDDAAQTLTLSGVVSNATTAGSLTKTGAGTLVLSGTSNSYTGATTVTTGTLVVDGSTAAGSAVSVASGGTLGGTGTIGGTLALTGKLAPGAAGVVDIETLDAGTTTWNGGSIWNFDLSSSDDTSDKLVITGDLVKGTGTLGTDYVFNFMGSQPVWNTTYTLATFASAIDFTNGSNFTATNLGSGSYSTSFFTLNSNSLTFTAVPEPTTALAGLLLTAGLLRRRRR